MRLQINKLRKGKKERKEELDTPYSNKQLNDSTNTPSSAILDEPSRLRNPRTCVLPFFIDVSNPLQPFSALLISLTLLAFLEIILIPKQVSRLV